MLKRDGDKEWIADGKPKARPQNSQPMLSVRQTQLSCSRQCPDAEKGSDFDTGAGDRKRTEERQRGTRCGQRAAEGKYARRAGYQAMPPRHAAPTMLNFDRIGQLKGDLLDDSVAGFLHGAPPLIYAHTKARKLMPLRNAKIANRIANGVLEICIFCRRDVTRPAASFHSG